jgi:hypothetical protein
VVALGDGLRAGSGGVRDGRHPGVPGQGCEDGGEDGDAVLGGLSRRPRYPAYLGRLLAVPGVLRG